MQTLFNFLIRLVLLAAGLVFAAALLVVMTLVASAWGLRYLWARLTGRPVTPFVFRMDPRAGFGQVYRGRWPGGATSATAAPLRPERRELGEVTDVEVKVKPPRA